MTGIVGLVNEQKDMEVGVTHFPTRTKPCLYIRHGNVSTKVASFNNEESADWFINEMKDFFNKNDMEVTA